MGSRGRVEETGMGFQTRTCRDHATLVSWSITFRTRSLEIDGKEALLVYDPVPSWFFFRGKHRFESRVSIETDETVRPGCGFSWQRTSTCLLRRAWYRRWTRVVYASSSSSSTTWNVLLWRCVLLDLGLCVSLEKICTARGRVPFPSDAFCVRDPSRIHETGTRTSRGDARKAFLRERFLFCRFNFHVRSGRRDPSETRDARRPPSRCKRNGTNEKGRTKDASTRSSRAESRRNATFLSLPVEIGATRPRDRSTRAWTTRRMPQVQRSKMSSTGMERKRRPTRDSNKARMFLRSNPQRRGLFSTTKPCRITLQNDARFEPRDKKRCISNEWETRATLDSSILVQKCHIVSSSTSRQPRFCFGRMGISREEDPASPTNNGRWEPTHVDGPLPRASRAELSIDRIHPRRRWTNLLVRFSSRGSRGVGEVPTCFPC